MNTNFHEHQAQARVRTSRDQQVWPALNWYRTLLLTAMAIGLTGCSGGSDNGWASDGSASNDPPPSITPPVGRGTVVVTVSDLLGAPAGGVKVKLSSGAGRADPTEVVADAAGRAEFKDVASGPVRVEVIAAESYAGAKNQTLVAGGTLTLELRMEPTHDGLIAGTLFSDFVTNKVSDDGRTFEFTLALANVTDPRDPQHDLSFYRSPELAPCVPDPANDLPRFHPDCVSGPDGFDAGYEGRVVSVTPVNPVAEYTFLRSTASALLLDQSSSVIVRDPVDERLFAAKYFLGLAKDSDPVVLAAFASDDGRTGQPALLPQKPTTIFPIDNPTFTSDGRGYFPTVDELAGLEGGAAPLFAAIDRMIDFVYAGGRRETNAVIVVTDGRDDSCGSRSACRDAIDRLTAKSRRAEVQIVTVGLRGAAAEEPDYETLGLLARSGASFVASDAKQLGPILGTVRELLQDAKRTQHAAFRIQSPVAGTFVSGRTVIGKVRYLIWDDWGPDIQIDVPFAVRIP